MEAIDEKEVSGGSIQELLRALDEHPNRNALFAEIGELLVRRLAEAEADRGRERAEEPEEPEEMVEPEAEEPEEPEELVEPEAEEPEDHARECGHGCGSREEVGWRRQVAARWTAAEEDRRGREGLEAPRCLFCFSAAHPSLACDRVPFSCERLRAAEAVGRCYRCDKWLLITVLKLESRGVEFS
ncbi:unnamed protein product [Caenorhabditis bovis]|uniref:Uncharacterized protein n=1 Tax=Caenorhabditis bovis TaxID=2654633 RepID=A0A8S1FAC6_9PELO|nr:unnamed protein product [Caenorhabditis bovis]